MLAGLDDQIICWREATTLVSVGTYSDQYCILPQAMAVGKPLANLDEWIDMCIDIGVDKGIDMFIDMGVDICVDMCIDMCIYVCIDV